MNPEYSQLCHNYGNVHVCAFVLWPGMIWRTVCNLYVCAQSYECMVWMTVCSPMEFSGQLCHMASCDVTNISPISLLLALCLSTCIYNVRTCTLYIHVRTMYVYLHMTCIYVCTYVCRYRYVQCMYMYMQTPAYEHVI